MNKIHSNIRNFTERIRYYNNGLLGVYNVRNSLFGILHKEESWKVDEFNRVFPSLLRLFLNPVEKITDIIKETGISKSDLVKYYRRINRSKFLKKVVTSSYYPRSLLIKAENNLVDFLQKAPDCHRIISGDEVFGPMMLEMHPTDAKCIYRCNMCLWCGGRDKTKDIKELYGNKYSLLKPKDWQHILRDAKKSGTRQIIFSGGGETLLNQSKIKTAIKTANSLGLLTMVYTNGRLLGQLEPSLLKTLLNCTWIRVSCHAGDREVYSRMVSRPIENNDLEEVKKGISLIVSCRKKLKKKVKIGIGVVLQELNFDQIPLMADLSRDMDIDFIDIRVDCVGISKKLTKKQQSIMFNDLSDLRDECESKKYSFKLSIADDLIIKMDHWRKMKLPASKRCWVPFIRPSIDPYGVVGACDIIGEPYTRKQSPPECVLGKIGEKSNLQKIMLRATKNKLGTKCPHCMPGQISLNALFDKIVADQRIGIKPTAQPFFFR